MFETFLSSHNSVPATIRTDYVVCTHTVLLVNVHLYLITDVLCQWCVYQRQCQETIYRYVCKLHQYFCFHNALLLQPSTSKFLFYKQNKHTSPVASQLDTLEYCVFFRITALALNKKEVKLR
jgi:hypothetical protein